MRSLLSLALPCAALLAVMPAAVADPADPEVEVVELVHDSGRCEQSDLFLSSEVPVRLDVTVRNQFDQDARVRIPKFLWQHDLPVTVAPVTFSVKFEAAAGEYAFDVVTGADDRPLCEGTLFVL